MNTMEKIPDNIYDIDRALIDLSKKSSDEKRHDKFKLYMKDVYEGRYAPLDSEFQMLETDSKWTEGSQIVMLCGSGGSKKSFFMGYNLSKWALNGYKVKAWSAEDQSSFHVRRALASIIGNMNINNNVWCMENKGAAEQIIEENSELLKTIESIFENDMRRTKKNMIKFCTQYAQKGYDAIMVDPITFFSGSNQIFQDDLEILEALDDLKKKYYTRFYLVTHPRDDKPPHQDNLAGGRGFGRFTQCVLWLSPLQNKAYMNRHVNLEISVLKNRNAPDVHGGSICYFFNQDDATFQEICARSELNSGKTKKKELDHSIQQENKGE